MAVYQMNPWLYRKAVSTGDFSDALEALLGPNAKGLSAKTITVSLTIRIWRLSFA